MSFFILFKRLIVIIILVNYSLLINIKNQHLNQNKPIIGIISNPFPENSNTSNISIIYLTYANYAQSLGAAILPILINYSEDKLIRLIKNLNGIIFQGGMRNLQRDGEFEKKSEMIINIANKNKVPIFFICQGFELLVYILCKDLNILTEYNSYGYTYSSEILKENIHDSKMFKYFSEEDLKLFEDISRPSTIHYHNFGIREEDFKKYNQLTSQLKITSFGYDNDKKKFINTYESLNTSDGIYFGVQFHPEKSSFSNDNNENALSSFESNYIASLILAGFMSEVYKSMKNKGQNRNINGEEDLFKNGLFYLNQYVVKDKENYLKYEYDKDNKILFPLNVIDENDKILILYLIGKIMIFILIILIIGYIIKRKLFRKKNFDEDIEI